MENYKSLPTNSMKFLSSNAQVHDKTALIDVNNETELIDADLTNLKILIKRQKESNNLLRELANLLHSCVEKLSGEFPNIINDYDSQEEKEGLSYIHKLEITGRYYEAIIEDIKYSLDNLQRSI
jgi:hypothetical protein